MSTSPSPAEARRRARGSVQIGVLAPLSRPGWVEAGRQLVAGMQRAVRDANDAGGVSGRPLELVVRDTAADPQKAVEAVEELARLGGVTALAGEYHSVVARAAAARADAVGVPFLCSSAVLDALTERPTGWVARLAPPQSRGWRVFAEFLLDAGHRRVAVAAQTSAYWTAGIRILREHLAFRDATVIELDPGALERTVADELLASRASALLLLVGHPEPAVSIVKSVRRDQRLAEVMIGAPAGQPDFDEWITALGDRGAAIPFLRYLPERFDTLGSRVGSALRTDGHQRPSFVAFEGYDTISVLAHALRAHGTDRAGIAESWGTLEVEGTRGLITFSRPSTASSVWQWGSPPIQVVDRDPARPDRFRVLHTD